MKIKYEKLVVILVIIAVVVGYIFYYQPPIKESIMQAYKELNPFQK